MGPAPHGRNSQRGDLHAMTARHRQVAEDLRRLITSGELAAGERLIPEARLATHYRVSVPTLREALELLRAEGLIDKFQGRGNFVRQPPERLVYPRSPSAGLHVIVSSEDIAATGAVCTSLSVQADTPVTQYICLSHRGEIPQTLAHVYVPHAVARFTMPRTGASPWGDDILRRLADAAGLSVASSTDQVTARFPTGAEVQSLRLGAKVPVLAVERTSATTDGVIVAYSTLVLPGDRSEVILTSLTDQKEATV
jgi:GntR family transcriptional regulator